MRPIDADVLLEKVREIRKLALDRVLETPDYTTYPIFHNPAHTRYSTQADEREKFKVMIEEAPTVQPEQRWILCSERQPDVNGWYITTISGEICGQDRAFSGMSEFANGKWTSGDDVDETEMTIAWMPLPEPYKAERGEAYDR